MKYIVVSFNTRGVVREFPFIFPDAVVHKDMYQMVERNLIMQERADSVECVGAGFISCRDVDPGESGCYGASESLNVKSRGPEDSRLISLLDYTHGLKV